MKGPSETQVISKSYLSGLIIKCSLFFGIGLILTGVILYFSAHQPLGPSYQESFARLSQLKQEMLFKSVIIYSTLMFIIMAGVIFTTLMYSHRVVGPMIGLKRIIGLLNKYDLRTPAILRAKDAIKPTADALNNMMDEYKTTLKAMTDITKEMHNIAGQQFFTSQLNEISSKTADLATVINKLKVQ